MGFRDHKNILVVGMARSGRAVCALLSANGCNVTAWDDNPRVLSESDPESLGATAASTETVEKAARTADCVVVSPGVPADNRIISVAKDVQVPVVGEIEAAYHFTNARIVAVTGTNGKSTTVGVIGAILERAGIDVTVAGNVGAPFADAVRERDYDTIVLELSSFQLDTIDEFRADVTVLLNVTPDHLDRYDGSFDAYAASKGRLLLNASEDTLYVFNDVDDVARSMVASNPGPSIGFSSEGELETGVYLHDGNFVRRLDGTASAVMPRSGFSPVGVHNAENALASIAAIIPFGIDDDTVRDALREYRALPHRMELVRVINGVGYINDSKATNVDATAKSIRSVEGSCVVILGGRDKDGNFASLVPLKTSVRRAILIGESASVIRSALESHWDVEMASDMMDAVRRASEVAEPGDTVLLAPACASFDMFANYEERGEAFRASVNQLEGVGA